MRYTIPAGLALLCCIAPAEAQEVSQATRVARMAVETSEQAERARVGVESRIIRGVPYSGDAITESVQVLADGTRIVRKTVTKVYRDSEGRTRRDQLSNSGDVLSITISDPIAESQYVLVPATKTAHRNGVIMATPGGGTATASIRQGAEGTVTATKSPDGNVRVEARSADAEAARKREVEAGAVSGTFVGAGGRGGSTGSGGGTGAGVSSGGGGGVGGTMVVYPAEGSMMMRVPGSSNVKKEDLGQQVIEGVLATGGRSITTIPAGAIGNDRDIEILSEQWFSDDLKVLIMTKHNDPRSGQTIYRLTNVVQGEQPRTLFEVPADYTLRDSVIRRQSPQGQ